MIVLGEAVRLVADVHHQAEGRRGLGEVERPGVADQGLLLLGEGEQEGRGDAERPQRLLSRVILPHAAVDEEDVGKHPLLLLEAAEAPGHGDRDGFTPDGSIMMIVATDAPLDARNLERLAQRALVGLARTGATMSNGSGDYVIAFSTAESVRREADAPSPQQRAFLSNDAVSPLFQAVAEATEEAIYNSLFRATPVGDVEALPLDRTLDVLRRHGALRN